MDTHQKLFSKQTQHSTDLTDLFDITDGLETWALNGYEVRDNCMNKI